MVFWPFSQNFFFSKTNHPNQRFWIQTKLGCAKLSYLNGYAQVLFSQKVVFGKSSIWVFDCFWNFIEAFLRSYLSNIGLSNWEIKLYKGPLPYYLPNFPTKKIMHTNHTSKFYQKMIVPETYVIFWSLSFENYPPKSEILISNRSRLCETLQLEWLN